MKTMSYLRKKRSASEERVLYQDARQLQEVTHRLKNMLIRNDDNVNTHRHNTSTSSSTSSDSTDDHRQGKNGDKGDESSCKNVRFHLVQQNGQRVYEPEPDCEVEEPPPGTEVFVGNLPQDMCEDEILPIFERIGPIYKVRTMVDFTGRNRGYGFVCFFRPEDARRAVKKLNGVKVRNGASKLVVVISVDNRRLFVGNLPRDRSPQEIKLMLGVYLKGAVDMIVYPEPYDPNQNRGYLFVEFENHRQAAIARRQLGSGALILWGQTIFVDWAVPVPQIAPEDLATITKLHVSNVPLEISSEGLRKILVEVFGWELSKQLVKVHKMVDFAFVHFPTHKAAREAYGKMKDLHILRNKISVQWARPIEFSRNYRFSHHPGHFCRSVPPGMRRIIFKSIKDRQERKLRQQQNRNQDPQEQLFEAGQDDVYDHINNNENNTAHQYQNQQVSMGQEQNQFDNTNNNQEFGPVVPSSISSIMSAPPPVPPIMVPPMMINGGGRNGGAGATSGPIFNYPAALNAFCAPRIAPPARPVPPNLIWYIRPSVHQQVPPPRTHNFYTPYM